MAQSRRKKNSKNEITASKKNKAETPDNSIRRDIYLCIVFCIAILIFLSNIGFGGVIGDSISAVLFGLFGSIAFLVPLLIFFAIAFYLANKNNPLVVRKLVGGALFLMFFCVFLELFMELIWFGYDEDMILIDYYIRGVDEKLGGGFIGGMLVELFTLAFNVIGAWLLTAVGLLVSAIIMTQKPLLKALGNKGAEVYQVAVTEHKRRKEGTFKIENADLKIDRADMNVLDDENSIENEEDSSKRKMIDIPLFSKRDKKESKSFKEENQINHSENSHYIDIAPIPVQKLPPVESDADALKSEEQSAGRRVKNPKSSKEEIENNIADMKQEIKSESANNKKKNYKMPPLKLLRAAGHRRGDSEQHLRETAAKLQQTLHSFGVEVTVTNASCGPTVTRYELQPEQGVKVSKIVSLTDDIKLNLAATDIRIEAPIPGKAAIGIEVPNQENALVTLRELLQSDAYVNSNASLSFAVGKDIAGKAVIADIARMPHLLIAGATGSGKSVCINTLIMSLLFKYHPDDVKLIMIDPKVVELSVYNGIPHLLVPVVTDPKKAAGALNWAVAEMTDRYNKFAEFNVRDLKSYNEKVDIMRADPAIKEEEKPVRLPKIVIIVDELADLMMVAPGEVEDAICRLAQLARAAGLHLIIATQRPSVNVITGLIKANMPSRIAFAVSSGVDSRTILDMNGAEKLLGNGDMLFYPQGYPKPARLQGSYVSEEEVASVVKFLASQQGEVVYNNDIENKIVSIGTTVSGAAASANERDAYFAEAGRFIIEKDKASIGMLQRVFKIGFNRAARIMDQLCEAGVVGEEEGTKPRKVLMSMEQFEQVIEELV